MTSLISELKHLISNIDESQMELDLHHLDKVQKIIENYKTKLNNGTSATSSTNATSATCSSKIPCICNQLCICKCKNIDEMTEKEIEVALFQIRGDVSLNNADQMNIPDLEVMQSLHPRIIKKWIEIDKRQHPNAQLLFIACEKNKPTELIIWLVETGFRTTSFNTAAIARNGNFDLLKFYHQTKLEFNMYTPLEAISAGRLDILTWLFDNNLIDSIQAGYVLHCRDRLMEKAVILNNIDMLDYLKTKGITLKLELFYTNNHWYFKDYDNEKKKVKNTTLLWLWNNGYKWTAKDAEKCSNNFMKGFFE
jgi:hypothetical protein